MRVVSVLTILKLFLTKNTVVSSKKEHFNPECFLV